MLPSSNALDGAPSAQGRRRVLVVEDEFLIRLLVCDELREAGYHVIEAIDGDEALSFLQHPIQLDLILSDVRMPGSIDGLGLLTYVKANLPALPVILMSGHLERGLAMSSGAAEFLAKPFSLNVVTDAVRLELEKSHDIAPL
jgi:DNA-binding NtrC family response regulator